MRYLKIQLKKVTMEIAFKMIELMLNGKFRAEAPS